MLFFLFFVFVFVFFFRRGEGQRNIQPLGAKESTNNKLDARMTSMPGFEPSPYWWEASALTPSFSFWFFLCLPLSLSFFFFSVS